MGYKSQKLVDDQGKEIKGKDKARTQVMFVCFSLMLAHVSCKDWKSYGHLRSSFPDPERVLNKHRKDELLVYWYFICGIKKVDL